MPAIFKLWREGFGRDERCTIFTMKLILLGEWQAAIKEECEKLGMDFLSSVFDPSAIDFLDTLGVEMYKIASPELVDIPLILYAASKGKPMIISCGMGTAEEICEAVEACKSVNNDQIVLFEVH